VSIRQKVYVKSADQFVVNKTDSMFAGCNDHSKLSVNARKSLILFEEFVEYHEEILFSNRNNRQVFKA
jgi:hypothetical protein